MRSFIYIGIAFFLLGCTPQEFRPRTGDMLFEAGGATEMSEAITAATGSGGGIDFTHVGIALRGAEADSVLEATTEGGVRIVPLRDFLAGSARINGRPAVVAMRLKDTTGLAAAVARARSHLGEPYDYAFRPGNGKMYCSELVWESYRTEDGTPLFTARPMNFRAGDGSMPPYWSDLFSRLGEAVPEGVPGTNPNDMAREEILKEVFRYF